MKLITSQDKSLEEFSQKKITAQLKVFVESIM